jgi:hypothetical protein
VTESFSADWLALREPFDAAARSLSLGQRFVAALPDRPRILDLGAGTGSMFRWLSPIIDREQSWILADAKPALLEQVRASRIELLVLDLAKGMNALPFDAVDGVVCSALLDLVSESWLHDLVGALRTPFLACLSVDGRDRFDPYHRFDPYVFYEFGRDQFRDKGFGPALGPRAPTALQTALAARGFTTSWKRADWQIPATAAAMLRELVAGYARVGNQQPARRAWVDAWEHDRLEQISGEKLAIRIGHRDILALPR